MHPIAKLFLFLICLFFVGICSNAQVSDTLHVPDTIKINNTLITADTTIIPAGAASAIRVIEDSVAPKKVRTHTPRGATIRSAILPGWGQVYNHKLWKVPIVYAALGGTSYYFFDNLKWYKRLRYAYPIAYAINHPKSPGDTIGSPAYQKIYERLKGPFFENGQVYDEALRSERDNYRRDVDYAALYFLIAWGLNVIEATVDAHLSHFDISPDLTLNIQPGYSEMARTNGLSLVLTIK